MIYIFVESLLRNSFLFLLGSVGILHVVVISKGDSVGRAPEIFCIDLDCHRLCSHNSYNI